MLRHCPELRVNVFRITCYTLLQATNVHLLLSTDPMKLRHLRKVTVLPMKGDTICSWRACRHADFLMGNAVSVDWHRLEIDCMLTA